MIGYLLDRELVNTLGGRPVATLLTQVIVDRDDPAFARPRSRSAPSTTARPRTASPPSSAGRLRPTARITGAWWPRRSRGRSSNWRRCGCSSARGSLVSASAAGASRSRRPRRPSARRRSGHRQGPRGGAARAGARRRRAAAPHRRAPPSRPPGGRRRRARSANDPRPAAALDVLRRWLDGPEGRSGVSLRADDRRLRRDRCARRRPRDPRRPPRHARDSVSPSSRTALSAHVGAPARGKAAATLRRRTDGGALGRAYARVIMGTRGAPPCTRAS